MGLSDEMQRLTDHLREAYEARMESVAAIRADAVQDLARLHADHQERAAALRRQLGDAERDRRTEAGEAARHRARYVDSLRRSVASTLKELAGEMSEARQIWGEFSGVMRQARAGAPGRPAASPAEERLPGRRQRRGFRRR